MLQGYFRFRLRLRLRTATPSASTPFLTTMSLRCSRPLRPSLPSISATSQLIGLRAFHLRPTIASRLRVPPCSAAPTGAVEVDWNDRQRFKQKTVALPFWRQQNSSYGRFAYQDFSSDDDSDVEFASPRSPSQQQLGDSTLENIDEWRWKLTMLLRNKDDQEVVSREKKDRRDFEQLSALATRMGLYGRQYAKIVVFSKAPLPNYRPDLDDMRPQREVILPFTVHREVETHLRAHLSQRATNRLGSFDDPLHRSSDARSIHANEGIYEQPEHMTHNSVVKEKILRRRSLQLHNQQQEWQESPEGQRMLEFRRSLPAFKEKDAFLKVISENQVIVVSGETGCGKTTQLPQYILESEIEAARGAACNIICTQPRRISAMSVSERVAAERGEKLGESVSLWTF